MFKPLNDRVVIRPDEAETKSPGGIVLPDNAKERPQRGKVLAVGPGRILDDGRRATMTLKLGDHVVYSRYAGNEIEIDDGEVRIMSEGDVLAVID